MSCKGKAILDALHKRGDIIGDLALSTTLFYYVFESPSMGKHFFVTRSLADRSLVSQEEFPFAITCSSTSRLQLFGDEKWVAFRDKEARIWIVDTGSGKTVYSFYCGSDSRLEFSTTEGKFWAIQYTYPQLRAGLPRYLRCKRKYVHAQGTFARLHPGDRRVLLWDSTVSSSYASASNMIRKTQRQGFLLPLWQLSSPSREDGIRLGRLSKSSLATVTLPHHLPCMGSTWRELDLTRLRCMHDLGQLRDLGQAFCGMVVEYLVVHARYERELVVVDFWPDW